MKIFPFNPTASPRRAAGPSRERPLSAEGFDALLAREGSPPRALGLVSAENQRATRAAAAPADLKEASALLSTILEQARASSPAELRRLHSLDGVLCYYPL
ncbi:MAG: hypothetical protein LBO66_03135 [Deltaproteobacteria bacterium]|jgi:hypothetical protein|nr:hypothetical protein [Deltaproteobacteria bacterium]